MTFFFSSTRRHTRCLSDWSSDVCSSDLLMDYAVPRADDLPSFTTDQTVTPTPHNPMGAKGIGEAATIGSTPAIVNAVVDALRRFGVRHLNMPLRPERIWQAIRRRAGD